MPHRIPLPAGWGRYPKSAILQILALGHYAFTVVLAKAAVSRNRQVRLEARIDHQNR